MQTETEAMLRAQKATELKLNIQMQLANAGLAIKPKSEEECWYLCVL